MCHIQNPNDLAELKHHDEPYLLLTLSNFCWTRPLPSDKVVRMNEEQYDGDDDDEWMENNMMMMMMTMMMVNGEQYDEDEQYVGK